MLKKQKKEEKNTKKKTGSFQRNEKKFYRKQVSKGNRI
jgi:hypothetical protein